MARTKRAARRGGGLKTEKRDLEASQAVTTTHDAASLIDKAHTLLAQSNFELAIKFLERALEVEPSNLEARELLGVAELEGGDVDSGREHLLHLLPPHTSEPPSHPSPYLYLAQCAQDPQEALGYYTTATAILERRIAENERKGKGKAVVDITGEEEGGEEERQMAVTALVAMIEIWMSDLCFEEAAEKNCDALIARALSISPTDPEVKLSLASIRMSQSRFEEAKEVALDLYNEIEGKEAFDDTLPALPARLSLSRLLLEHSQHLEALEVLSTVREEDSLNVEGAYLEGWALYLRAGAIVENPSLLTVTPSLKPPAAVAAEGAEGVTQDEDEDETPMTAEECFSESMRSLIECAKLYSEQDYVDEGIGAHVAELLEELEKKGVQPAMGDLEDEDEDGDVEMAA
ncbi:hypothetical protein CI109_105723 [Kwoniella shandongensis]|uniref:Uncharacterized protein n=1 Tax=Kwoniella shandongensis TaxID=1734106 RepID=A0A5M6C1F6_9TREE|nr:uncharacterized protein CI109_003063 [Kwoniella shandongensis]KAA5528531.1 hypothetical protein CI109_003063 [Kwoniella shandongensis]